MKALKVMVVLCVFALSGCISIKDSEGRDCLYGITSPIAVLMGLDNCHDLRHLEKQ